MSETMRAFRASLPPISTMEIGEEFFVPTMSAREENALLKLLRVLNASSKDKRWFAPLEWRSHIRGRCIVCVSRSVEREWEKLILTIRAALASNRRTPPLDRSGNAIIPPLPRR
jgi:hypothetical protein